MAQTLIDKLAVHERKEKKGLSKSSSSPFSGFDKHSISHLGASATNAEFTCVCYVSP